CDGGEICELDLALKVDFHILAHAPQGSRSKAAASLPLEVVMLSVSPILDSDAIRATKRNCVTGALGDAMQPVKFILCVHQQPRKMLGRALLNTIRSAGFRIGRYCTSLKIDGHGSDCSAALRNEIDGIGPTAHLQHDRSSCDITLRIRRDMMR